MRPVPGRYRTENGGMEKKGVPIDRQTTLGKGGGVIGPPPYIDLITHIYIQNYLREIRIYFCF